MGERTNGYVTVIAGMPDSPAPGGRPDRRLTQERRQELAHRLRKQGFSYRRIADSLGIPYPTVRAWMDDIPGSAAPGLGASLAPPGRARAQPHPAESLTSMAIPAMSVPSIQMDEIRQRLDELAAAQRAQMEAIAALEQRLLSAVRTETTSWGERILNAIKALWGRDDTKTLP